MNRRPIIEVIIYKNDIPDDLEFEGDLAIDTEAMGLKPNRDRLCVLQMSIGDGNSVLVHFDGKDYNAPNLKKLLSDQSRVKIFHFARFDLAVIQKYLGLELENVYCTKIASRLSRTYTQMHSLKELCRELIGVNISKGQQTSNWGASELTKDQQEYAARDVVFLHRIRDELNQRLRTLDRYDLAFEIFGYLNIRAKLDLLGWENEDIFSHTIQ